MDTARLDRLYVKLFAVIAGAIAALTVAAYAVFAWSFERGFVDYLNRADEVRLEALADRLGDAYLREQGWDRIANDRQRWSELSRDALGLPPPDAPKDARAASRRDTPLTIDPRLLLLDAGRNRLIGRPEAEPRAVLKPIAAGGRTVGYLGYVPRPEIVASIESAYVRRQRRTLGAIASGMLLAALALGAGLAGWLTRRVGVLARGTQALIRGDYGVRLDAPGHDELAQLARDFNALASTLAATREARRQWIADIAHELRTPVALIRAEIESLQDGVRPLDQTSIASLAHEVIRLARLVEDLHMLSMSDLGALSYHKEPVPVAEIVEDAVDAQRRALAERGLVVETALDATARVLADETRLAQVFANLLQNNLRYTTTPGTVRVTARRDDGHVTIDWEDSGPGVAPDVLPRLGERLFRVEGSRSRSAGGSGLGLAIARAIAEGHGGTLSAHRSALGGLDIRLVLPRLQGAPHG